MKKKKKKSPDDLESLRRSDDSPVTGWLSSGSTILDLAVADRLPGGFPVGRWTIIYGLHSTAKTVLGTEPLGYAQRHGGHVWMWDVERTFDEARAKSLFSLDTKSKLYHYANPRTVEDLFDGHIAHALEYVRKHRIRGPCAGVTDSLSALVTRAELKKELGTGYGTEKARINSAALRKWLGRMSDANFTWICVDQARINISATFGADREIQGGGGVAPSLYASVRILMKDAGAVKNKRGVIIGRRFRFKVDKNKVAPPFRSGVLRLLFDYGIDDVGGNLWWLREAWQKMGDKGPFRIGKWRSKSADDVDGLAEATRYVEKNNLERILRREVRELWKEFHKAAERKPRVRFG